MTVSHGPVTSPSSIKKMSQTLRVLCADMVEQAGSGHPGMPMGMADVATVLFANHLRFDPFHPEWAARDRFVLSAGHGSALVYALLHLIGQPDMTLDQIKTLRKRGSLTPGHPEYGHTAGIECTTGPLGQGLATAVGMAISEKKLRAELASEVSSHRIFVIAGDGCLMEGISHEAGSLAGHLKLDNLVVLFDDNGITIDGAVDIASSEAVLERFSSYGWTVDAVDGHDHEAIDQAIAKADEADGPVLIACKTTIGKGAPNKAGSAGIHGSPLGADEIAKMRSANDWPHAPFEFDAEVLDEWRAIGTCGKSMREEWQDQLAKEEPPVRARLDQIERGVRPSLPQEAVSAARKAALDTVKPIATRVASKNVLENLVAQCPWILGGSADLSGSNGTQTGEHDDFGPESPSGNYVRYGVREHGMAAAMNGIALSGAYVPYGGTFLVFSDYCRPSIRLAALMQIPSIFVFTHDSVGLGEDGPTHQPVEHLASLRLIPGLVVLRPADAVETAEAWEIALQRKGPTVIALTRQNVPLLRQEIAANRSEAGAYKLFASKEEPVVTLLATGSEVHLAHGAAKLLEEDSIPAEVISVPSLELTSECWLEQLRGSTGSLIVAIEAGASLPWKHIVGPEGLVIGIDFFGESASGSEMFEIHGLTVEALAATITSAIDVK